jgi:site-specific recombinase XerD
MERDIKVIFENGVFKELFLQFIHYKQSLGFQYGLSIQTNLQRLNSRLNEFQLDTPRLTKEIAESLGSKRSYEAPATQQKRISLLRHFAEFLNDMGYEAYVYPINYNVKWSDCFAPYIFSHEQINSIFLAADLLKPMKVSPTFHLVWPTFLRVLYGCGLRLSETLKLRTIDVDLDAGIIYVNKSKKGTSRYVPMSVSLRKCCLKYAQKINLTNSEYFFPAPGKDRYSINAAFSQIKKIYAKAGIPHLSNGRLPRVHDLRHTYCCHALEQMQKMGLISTMHCLS